MATHLVHQRQIRSFTSEYELLSELLRMLREIEEGRGHTSIIDFRTRMRHYLLHGNADARFTTEDQPANLAELPY